MSATRYASSLPARSGPEWSLERVTSASRLFGANGLRTGPDGRLYVAQVSGSQVSAIDVDTGAIEVISPTGGAIIGPDDLAFDSRGSLYVTEFTEGRLSVRAADGMIRVLNGDLPGANPVTVHQDRLFVGECRPAGRIMEVNRATGATRVLVADVPLPNAMEVGPDGYLYFPVMGTNEIWKVHPDGGAPEVVAGDLGVPDAVKFDASGHIISTQCHSGQVLRIDPRTGEKTVLADIEAGLDNVSLVNGRIFVSHFSGRIVEVLGEGRHRALLPSGFNWPLGLAMSDDGGLFVADGPFSYIQREAEPLATAGMLFTPGSPGYVRGVAAEGSGAFIVTTANGAVMRWKPQAQESELLAEGFDQLMGVAIGADGAVLFAELGAGKVHVLRSGVVETLLEGLDRPSGVAISADGDVYVAESGRGRVARLVGGRAETVLDGLGRPQGLTVGGGKLYVLDVIAKTVVELDLADGRSAVIASQLPVGPPQGVELKPLKPVLPLAGAMGPFAGLARGSDGALYIAADAEGSVLKLTPAAG